MKILIDPVFGEMTYEYGWIRKFSYQIFGHSVECKLVVPCDEGAAIELAQQRAFIGFESQKDELFRRAELAIYTHYLDVYNENPEKFATALDSSKSVFIADIGALANLLRPTEVIVQQSFRTEDRFIGLLFACTWEPELGLAVKIVNERIDCVGTQDIVL